MNVLHICCCFQGTGAVQRATWPAALKSLGGRASPHLLPSTESVCGLLSTAAAPSTQTAQPSAAAQTAQPLAAAQTARPTSATGHANSTGDLGSGCALVLALQSAGRYLQQGYANNHADSLRLESEHKALSNQLLQLLVDPWLLQTIQPMAAVADVWQQQPGLVPALQVNGRGRRRGNREIKSEDRMHTSFPIMLVTGIDVPTQTNH